VSQPDIEQLAEAGLPKPKNEQNAKAFYGFVVKPFRLIPRDSSTTPLAAELALIQHVIKRHRDQFDAELRNVLLKEDQE
jgi:hypothetical protein